MKAGLGLPPVIDGDEDFKTIGAYWDGLRGDEMLPDRTRLRLGDLGGASLECAIYEWHEPDRLVFRFAGQDVNDRGGREMTGINFFDYVTPAFRDPYLRIVTDAMRWPCGYVVHFPDLEEEFGRVVGLQLPLTDALGRPRYLMSIVGAKKDGAPVRLNRAPARSTSRLVVTALDLGAGVPWESLTYSA